MTDKSTKSFLATVILSTAALKGNMFNWPTRPDPQNDIRVIEAEIWARKADRSGDGLDDVVASARRQHERVIDANRRLDGKAEWMFTIASAAAGIVVVYWEKTRVDILWSLAPLSAFLWAMWLSMISRAPTTLYDELSIDQAIEVQRNSAHQYKFWVASQLMVASTAMVVINEFKAKMVNYAARTVVVGTVLIGGVIGFFHSGCHQHAVESHHHQPPKPCEAGSMEKIFLKVREHVSRFVDVRDGKALITDFKLFFTRCRISVAVGDTGNLFGVAETPGPVGSEVKL